MRVNHQLPQPHQRRHAYGVARIVGKDQEGRGVGNEATVQGNPVGKRRHAELAHAIADVVAARLPVGGSRAAPVGEIRPGQVGRTTQQLGQERGDCLDHVLRCLACRHGTGLSRQLVEQGGHPGVPVARQITARPAFEFGCRFGVGGTIRGEIRRPDFFGGFATGGGIPAAANVVRDFERGKWPFELAASIGDFAGAQGRTMHVVRAPFVRRTKPDHRLAADQRRPPGLRLGDANRRLYRIGVMPVAVWDDAPAVGLETLRRVIGEPGLDVAVDRDVIVVIKDDQLGQ